jgi:hypothetical protein
MKVHYKQGELRPDQALLCVTHSDRVTSPKDCWLNYLEQRCASPDRLATLPPFKSLPHASLQSPYHGQVTLWEFVEGDWRRPSACSLLAPGLQATARALAHRRLWVLGVERLEV